MRKRAEEKFRERVLLKVEDDLQKMQKRYEDACVEIEADIKRQTFFNLTALYKKPKAAK